MIVHILSLGSVWQQQERLLGTSIWNTTGVDNGHGVRPRSIVYGQVALGRLAKIAFARVGGLAGTNWVAECGRGQPQVVRLIQPAPRKCAPERCLGSVTEQLVGRLYPEDCDPHHSQIISLSECRGHLEVMLLMRPYAWIKGERGSATLIPSGSAFRWQVTTWN